MGRRQKNYDDKLITSDTCRGAYGRRLETSRPARAHNLFL